MNPEHHYLKITLEGVPEPLVYRVSKETSERVERILSGMSADDLKTHGVGFDTPFRAPGQLQTPGTS